VGGRALRIRNSVAKCAFLVPLIARIFCSKPLIFQHFYRPVTPQVVGLSPLACHDFNGSIGGIIRPDRCPNLAIRLLASNPAAP
jgi:hypothetical protein